MNCEACTKPIKDPAVACATCKKVYHIQCVNLTLATYNRLRGKKTWKCPCCAAKTKKGDDTPARPGNDSEDEPIPSGSQDQANEGGSVSTGCHLHSVCIPTEALDSYLDKFLMKMSKKITTHKK